MNLLAERGAEKPRAIAEKTGSALLSIDTAEAERSTVIATSRGLRR